MVSEEGDRDGDIPVWPRGRQAVSRLNRTLEQSCQSWQRFGSIALLAVRGRQTKLPSRDTLDLESLFESFTDRQIGRA